MLYFPVPITSFLLSFIFLSLLAPSSSAECINRDLSIAIDVGHSPKKPGASSATGVNEYAFNKVIAELLLKRLLMQGFKRSFIISQRNPEMPLHSRASFANAKRADLLISIHHDSVQDKYLKPWQYKDHTQHYSNDFSGFSVFVSEHNRKAQQSLIFADMLAKELLSLDFSPSPHHQEPIEGENRRLLVPEKGIYQYDELVILRRSKMPAVLFECGVIVNQLEEKKLSQKVYQQLIIAALERAILRFAAFPKETAYLDNVPLLPMPEPPKTLVSPQAPKDNKTDSDKDE